MENPIVGWVGSEDGWTRTKVGIVYRQRGITVEVAGIGHRGGKINNTRRLNLEETKAKIASLEYIQNELNGIPNLV